MSKSTNERQRNYRQRKRDQGLVKVELWIKPEYRDQAREKEKEWQG